MEGHPRQKTHPVGRSRDQPTGCHGCDNKGPQTCWFKTTDMYSNYSGDLASNISIDGLKSKSGQGHASSRGCRGDSFLLFQLWGGREVFGLLCFSYVTLILSPASSNLPLLLLQLPSLCLCVSPTSLLKDSM